MKSFFRHMGPLCITALLFACGDGSELANIDQHIQGSLYGTSISSYPDKPSGAPECLLSGPKSIHLEAKVKTSATKKVSFSNMGSGPCEVENVHLLLPPGTPPEDNPFSVRAYVDGVALTNANVASVLNNQSTVVESGNSLDVVISYTPQHDMGKDKSFLRIVGSNFFIEPIAIRAEITQADVTSITTGRTCDETLICTQTITCCDGQLYPTGCCSANCDAPIGECHADEDTPTPGCQLEISYGDAATDHSGVIDFGQVEQGDDTHARTLHITNTGDESCHVELNVSGDDVVILPWPTPTPVTPFILSLWDPSWGETQPHTGTSLAFVLSPNSHFPAIEIKLDASVSGTFSRTLNVSTGNPNQYAGTDSCTDCLWESIALQAEVMASEEANLGCILTGLPSNNVLDFATSHISTFYLINEGDETCHLNLNIVSLQPDFPENQPHFSFADGTFNKTLPIPYTPTGGNPDGYPNDPVAVPVTLLVETPQNADYDYQALLKIFEFAPSTYEPTDYEFIADITLKAHGNDNDNDDMMAPPPAPW